MTSEPEKQFSSSDLDSPEYRKRLMRKLNTLIAVLEVACAKVKRTLDGPDADTERLMRIQKNLTETLSVCRRAKGALERREALPADLPASIANAAADPAAKAERLRARSQGTGIELSSDEEREKFEQLGPIAASEIRGCDIDALCRRLLFG